MKAISMTITGFLILLSMGSQGIIAQSLRPSVPVNTIAGKVFRS